MADRQRRDIMTRLKLGPWLFEKRERGEGEGNVLDREVDRTQK